MISLGIKSEDPITLLLNRTGKVLISMLGVLKAGGTYIPIDPEYPKERIDHVLKDSGAKYFITTADRLNEFENTLNIDELLKFENDKNPDISVSENQLAYIIYTSGSTGKPKGVMI